MVVYRAGAATTSSQASLVRFRASIQFAPCSRIICRNPMLLCTCAPSSQHGSTRMATDHFSTALSYSKGKIRLLKSYSTVKFKPIVADDSLTLPLVHARTPSNEVSSNDWNFENCGLSQTLVDLPTQKLLFEETTSYADGPVFLQSVRSRIHRYSLFRDKSPDLTIVFALERSHGTCMQYMDVVWMIGVTITNLGFGDFTPR